MATTLVFITATGSGTWAVPAGWTSATFETVGAGGGAGNGSSTGAGGGAYSSSGDISVTPGTVCNYNVGVGGAGTATTTGTTGGDTWIATNNTATLITSPGVVSGAKGGTGAVTISGTSGNFTAAGGAAASGVGSIKSSGGDGTGSVNTFGSVHQISGGGGAAGPLGVGGNSPNANSLGGPGGGGNGGGTGGSNATGGSGVIGGVGGNNQGGSGSGASTANGTNGGGGGGANDGGTTRGNGGAGTEWDSTHGSGGGGGGPPHTSGSTRTGGDGGLYGGGAGGGGQSFTGTGPSGGQGLIAITGTYSPTSDVLPAPTFAFRQWDDIDSVWRVKRSASLVPAPPTPMQPPQASRSGILWSDDIWRVPRGTHFEPFVPPPLTFGFPYIRMPRPDWSSDLSRWYVSRPQRQSLNILPVPLISQLVDEALVGDEPLPRVSQFVNEALVGDAGIAVRVSQLTLEVLLPAIGVSLPATYPTLGVGFSVMKRPLWGNSVSTAGSGREVRLGFWQFPLWEWDLTYEYLPDYPGNGFTASDLKTLMGFDLATNGLLLPFLFLDPDDNTVTAQPLGTTDGVTTIYTVFRTYGLAPNVGTEPVGYLNLAATFHVYLDGVLVNPSDYTVLQTIPVNQQIKFNVAPAVGQVITVDCSYYYYARILEDKLDFEKFLHMLWLLKKITLRSLRG